MTEEGEAGTVIHKVLQHQGADLVMMPTRGCGPLRRLLLGSVTAKVLHDVSAAVWTSTGAAIEEHTPTVPYKSIICALDETAESEVILRAAAALAKSYQANLALVHVLEMPPATAEIDFSPYRQDLIDAGHAHMRRPKRTAESGRAGRRHRRWNFRRNPRGNRPPESRPADRGPRA